MVSAVEEDESIQNQKDVMTINSYLTNNQIITDSGVVYSNVNGVPNIISTANASSMSQQPKTYGYIVELEEMPLVKKEIELVNTANKTQQFIDNHPVVSTITTYRYWATTPEKIKPQLNKYRQKIENEHQAIKEKIRGKISKNLITGNAVADENSVEVLSEFKNTFNGIALNVSTQEAEEIKSVSGVKKVYPNYEVKTMLMDSVPLINADDVWQLDANGNNCAETGEECLTGEGVTIAIIDTGVDYTHEDLGGCISEQFLAGNCGKVIGGYDIYNNDNDPMDDHGHGTHCAAIAAGGGADYLINYKEGDLIKFRDKIPISKGDSNAFTRLLYVKEVYYSFELSVGTIVLQDFLTKENFRKIFYQDDIPTLYFTIDGERYYIGIDLNSINNLEGEFNFSLYWGAGSSNMNGGDFSSEVSFYLPALHGVAPDAKIYAYKVLDNEGRGTMDGVILGIERAVDPNQDGDFSDHVDVISMSLGGGGNPDDAVSTAVDNAVDAGVVAVIAAGNNGPGENTIGSPGTARKAITVGATDKNDQIADFSSRGPIIWEDAEGKTQILIKPDVIAPGVNICAAQYDSAWDNKKCLDNNHVAISGTSMATPHVTGAVALLKQKNPDWSPEEIKMALRNSAFDLEYNITIQGYGRLDVEKSIKLENIAIAEIEGNGDVSGNINIFGTARGNEFSKYEVYIGKNNDWNLICSGNEQIDEGILCSDFDTSSSPDGYSYLKLIVYNHDDSSSEDLSLINIKNIFISTPNKNDIFGANKQIWVEGTIINSHFSRYYLEWGYGENPSEWYIEGIDLEGEGLNPIINGRLAGFDLSIINKPSFITIKLNVIRDDDFIFTRTGAIFVNPYLKEGFPVTVPYKENQWPSFSDHVSINSKNEIIFPALTVNTRLVDDGLYSYNFKGELLNRLTSPLFPIVYSMLNYDSSENFKDIYLIAFGPKYQNNYGGYARPSHIVRADQAGFETVKTFGEHTESNLVEGLSIIFSIISDIDLDGKRDFIYPYYTFDSTIGEITKGGIGVISNNGSFLNEWTPESGITPTGYQLNLPFVTADLDRDGFKEVIASYNYWTDVGTLDHSKIIIFDDRGSIKKQFDVGSNHFVSPLLAVADLNDDGNLEIIYGSKKLEVYNFNGEKLFEVNPFQYLDSDFNEEYDPVPIHSLSIGLVEGKPSVFFVAGLSNNRLSSPNLPSKIVAIDGGNNPILISEELLNTTLEGIAIENIDDDPNNEFITIGYGRSNQYLHIFDDDGKLINQYFLSVASWRPLFEEWLTPLIYDIDEDGKNEIIVLTSSYDYNEGDLDHLHMLIKLHVFETNGIPSNSGWNQFQHDPQHTGCYDCDKEGIPVTPRTKSIINNTGNASVEGHLLMKVEKYDNATGIWIDKQIIVNDSKDTAERIIPAKGYLALDTIWNEAGGYTTTEAGRFRVYASLRDENMMTMITSEGNKLEASYEFEVI